MSKRSKPKRIAHTQGYSLLGAMIAIFIGLMASSAAMSMLGNSTQETLGALSQATTADLRKHVHVFQETALGASANPNGSTAVQTIKVCSLSTVASNRLDCQPYSTGSPNQCVVFVSSPLSSPESRLEVRAFRVLDQQLQYYVWDSAPANWNGAEGLCENPTGWINMSNTDTYRMTSFRLCQLDASAVTTVNRNYQQNCTSVLDGASNPRRKWMVVMTASPTQHTNMVREMFGVMWFQNPTLVSSI